MNRVVVGIGSNIDPYANIERALGELARSHRVVRRSALRVTAPVGFAEQPDFVNGAVLVETFRDPAAFKADLREIENRLGRVRTANKSGPRTIDLDIVAWNGAVVDDDYYSRDFLRSAVKELVAL